ncbi:MAG TPA: hypothetical protein PK948_11835 [Gemmatimonadales bacterium]|nr:hypothetical protein [Gemmatimonadales bacterium]
MAVRPGSAPMHASDIIVVGGGCYGTFYARQLERARARGVLEVERVLVVDRDHACQLTRDLPPSPVRTLVVEDWDTFFDGYFQQASVSAEGPRPLSPSPASGEGELPSYIVPSPLMPHLMFNWVLRRARALFPGRDVRQVPLEMPLGTPYETLAPDGTRYVSWADWLCPTHCIEPHTCPVIRAPRTWEMSETVQELVARVGEEGRRVVGPALFVTKHLTDGVGMFGVADAVAADRLLREAAGASEPFSLVVGTLSACHGAVGMVSVG